MASNRQPPKDAHDDRARQNLANTPYPDKPAAVATKPGGLSVRRRPSRNDRNKNNAKPPPRERTTRERRNRVEKKTPLKKAASSRAPSQSQLTSCASSSSNADLDSDIDPPQQSQIKTYAPNAQRLLVYPQVFFDATVKRGVRGLEEDYRKLKTISQTELQHKAQTCRRNPTKNRYTDVLCMDQSRVRLSETGHSCKLCQNRALVFCDYIHANYVKISNTRQFILTQGPIISTIIDFWNMVYQSQSGAIVMLCEIEENNKPKCAQYWPTDPKKTMICGDFHITLQNSTRCDGEVTVSRLNLTKAGTRTKPLSIDHHQWASWPDRGVPDSCRVAIELLAAVRHIHMPIIHCSAGIGRSGSLAAIEMCKELLKGDAAPLNVAHVVERLREQRLHSVQTPQQYVYINAALMEYCLMNGWAKEHPDYKKFKKQCTTV